eukprot:snap_masked-scaffold_9-processed-gene-10.46-mRNA-1 protein AED:1.00 eAED:1.00 QI:0/0/0/0/1/1/2/0/471
MENHEQKSDLEEHLIPREKEVAKSKRLIGLDLFRGLIMAVMAFDHLKDSIADTKQHGSEVWQGESADFNNSLVFFLARVVSDICAPGFFFTMGIGMVFFMESRRKNEMSFNAIRIFYAKRSFLIILIGRMLNVMFAFVFIAMLIKEGKLISPFFPDREMTWANDKWLILLSTIAVIFQVLTALGISMLLTSLVLTKIFYLLEMKLIALSDEEKKVEPHYQGSNPREIKESFPNFQYDAWSPWELFIRFFFIPGRVFTIGMVAYPVVPWIGLNFLGFAFGFLIKADRKKAISLFGYLSIAFLLLFLVMRTFFGRFGNERGFPVGDGSSDDQYHVQLFIEFFYTSKYPPSPAYALITMGINFGIIWIFSKPIFGEILTSRDENNSFWKKFAKTLLDFLLVLGNSPLIFYCAHMVVSQLVSYVLIFFYGQGYKTENFLYVFLAWIPFVISMYPICVWFPKFKQTKPQDSWWRLF